ncbi:MAG: hypothetical protein GY705_06565 [Bacteroidetes bacterium]|nr:hypothetical protein [Bacteroidota bacterium]
MSRIKIKIIILGFLILSLIALLIYKRDEYAFLYEIFQTKPIYTISNIDQQKPKHLEEVNKVEQKRSVLGLSYYKRKWITKGGEQRLETFDDFYAQYSGESVSRLEYRIITSELLTKIENENYDEVNKYLETLAKTKERSMNGLPLVYLIYSDLAKKFKTTNSDMLEKWSESSEHYAPYVVRAFYYINEAWAARGGGYARSIKSENFKIFKTKLRLAEKDLNHVSSLNISDPTAQAAMLIVTRGLGLGDSKRSLEFNNGLAIDPSFFFLYQNNMTDLLPKWGGSWEKAFNFASLLFDDSPKDSLAYSLILDYMFESIMASGRGDYLIQQAKRDYINEVEKKFTTEDPLALYVLTKIAKVKGSDHFRKDETSEAEASFMKIIEIEPDNDWAWYMLGQMYTKSMGKHERSLKCFDVAINLNDMGGLVFEERGMAAASAKKYTQCVDDITTAEDKERISAISYYYRGKCFAELGKKMEAERDYTQAIDNERNPRNHKFYLTKRATLYRDLGKTSEAIFDIKTILEIYPQDGWALNKLQEYEAAVLRKN